ncbi:trichohyalin-like [Epinephelus fuscoguttatus]|uniref:trichohyalin-like n=1 Tax=Epinephelus fuscoguttatus TaxID=293821 RepID=UPI0020D069FE|nr:trichohyalin-like [Epinephelus fuscoguttatus]
MLHVTDRQSLNFQFSAFTVLLFHPVVFLALIHSCTGQSQLIGPSQPIVALVGDDIILPCHLDPAMNVFDMLVEWARPDLDPRFVVVWRDGVELESKKHPSYRGRTSVFTDELKHGNVSLKLSNVRRSDEATYRCFIPEIDRDRALTVQLVVGAVSSPVIQMTKTMSEVVLQCESAGWYPEPEVLWLDTEGNLLSAGPTETLRGPDDLYTVSSNVTVDKRHGNNFTCRVHQKNINQTRETHVLVPDHFFMVPSDPSTPSTPGSQHVIIGSVIGCAALVLIAAAAVFVVWKQRRKKFKNNRRSHEDGPEQTEAETMVTCRSDNTGFQVVVEGEEERVPLMAGSEGQNNVDNRGEEKISQSHSEHEDPQVGAERETHQNQLVTNPDMDRTEGEREVKSIENEKLPLIATEGENHQEQDMTGRQVLRDRGEGGVEQKMKPVKKDSGLPVAEEAEGQKEQLQNVHSDQDVQKEEETQQEPMTDEDKKEKRNKKKKAKGKNEKQVKKGRSTSIGRKKNQRDPSQPEAERTTVEDETKLQSETQKRKETEKDNIELKPQKGNVSQHLLQDRKQEMREAEHKKDKDQEGNQSNIQRTTERRAEKQEKKLKEEKMENERKLQSERTEVKTQEGGDNQQVLDANRPEQTAEHENKKDKDQRDVTTTTGSKAEKQEEHMNKKVEETEGKRDGREDKPPSVSGETTETPDLKVHEDTAGGQKQEKELQAEKQQQETSLRKMGETKEQPKQSTKREWILWKERRKQGLGRKKGADITETPKEVNEVRQEGQQQAVQQQLDVKEDVTEQIQDFFKSLSERGAECQDAQLLEIDVRPIEKAKRRGKQQRKQVKEFHVDHQQRVCKKRLQEEDREQTQKSSKKVKECPEEQNDGQMESEDDSEKEQELTDEPEKMDQSWQQDHAALCQGDQQEELCWSQLSLGYKKKKKKKKKKRKKEEEQSAYNIYTVTE